MTPRLGFYGAVAVCAWVKGHSGRSRDPAERAARARRRRRRPRLTAQAPLATSRFFFGMSIRGWIRLTRAASAAGLATFAVATVFASPGGDVESFFNVWFYNGLLILACVIVGSRAHPRSARARRAGPHSRPRWRVGSFGEIWYAAVHPETYPSLGRCRLHRLLPADLPRHRRPAPGAHAARSAARSGSTA